MESKIPKERRKRNPDTKGALDENDFFITPNGSFWDCDGEYFNRYGYDIHGGYYVNKLDYIPGKDFIEELGCYPDEKEKYEKFEEDEPMDEEGDKSLDLEEGEEEINVDDFEKLGIEKKELEKILDQYGIDNKKAKKSKSKKNKKKEPEEDDEWEECSDESEEKK